MLEEPIATALPACDSPLHAVTARSEPATVAESQPMRVKRRAVTTCSQCGS